MSKSFGTHRLTQKPVLEDADPPLRLCPAALQSREPLLAHPLPKSRGLTRAQRVEGLRLKKPIQVSLRSKEEGDEPGYDLVCGQGRIEAFQALGFTEIPAIVVAVSKEDRLVRSLVENMARRMLQPLDLIREIVRLRANGDTNVQIAKKLGISDPVVGGLLALHKAGEERLLEATISGRIPLSIAMEIAKTDSVETQRALLKAYETKQLRGIKIRIVKRLIDQRRLFGKDYRRPGPRPGRGNTSAEGLVSTFRREQQRQRAFVRKAKVCEEKLTFLVTAFRKLCADENFVNLLRAESLPTMPAALAAKGGQQNEEAA
ncbi:MAG: chromosome partitioning protein ParB [Verrucomicrobia bacterium]|nr:chromosome partitioning protein ParB [Verrucomicrobiota bacterium]